MVDQKQALSLLFDRPKEPIFKEKGQERVIFDVPKSFVSERFSDVAFEVQNRFADDTTPHFTVRAGKTPDVSQLVKAVPRDAPFSLWVPRHSQTAGQLISLFMAQKTVDDLISTAAYVRDRINVQLFNYALNVVLIHRKDTKGIDIPTFVETFPDKFIDPRIIRQAREEISVIPEGSRKPITIPTDFSGSDLDPEHKLFYFREDLGINLHHWHWHLVFPFNGDREIVAKDRRGEIFYYMHQQMMVRYNCERLSNNMPPVERFSDFRAPIKEGYYSKLDTLVANRPWPGRPDNTTPQDLNRPADALTLRIADIERGRDNFIQAVDRGFVVTPQGQSIELDEVRGIDILGEAMESSILSPNPELYGNIHNQMHNLIGYAHDPDHRHLETLSVIGDSTTAMRDPVFYRVHAYIDDLFQRHKSKLTPYTPQQLTFQGITINSISVQQQQGQPNKLNTHWQQSDINLARGMDFLPRGDVFVRFTHLQHIPFTYTISVNNSGAQRLGMARIFMAPRNGYNRQPMNYNTQRLMMFELDKFPVQLKPGPNTVNRRSVESVVTIPYEQTFRNVDQGRPNTANSAADREYNICGCGWPDHMLIPKGTPAGMKYDLFVMISNYEEDRVVQDIVGTCSTAASFCGIRDRKFPDKKSMGYPFDRNGRSGVQNLNQFLTPNMKTSEVTITFNDRTIKRT